jgi:hypothetical protein
MWAISFVCIIKFYINTINIYSTKLMLPISLIKESLDFRGRGGISKV